MNNKAFGKTMENLRNRANVRQTNRNSYQKLVSRPSFVSQRIFSEKLVEVRKIGYLDLSKTYMYFHCNYIKKNMAVTLTDDLQIHTAYTRTSMSMTAYS